MVALFVHLSKVCRFKLLIYSYYYDLIFVGVAVALMRS